MLGSHNPNQNISFSETTARQKIEMLFPELGYQQTTAKKQSEIVNFQPKQPKQPKMCLKPRHYQTAAIYNEKDNSWLPSSRPKHHKKFLETTLCDAAGNRFHAPAHLNYLLKLLYREVDKHVDWCDEVMMEGVQADTKNTEGSLFEPINEKHYKVELEMAMGLHKTLKKWLKPKGNLMDLCEGEEVWVYVDLMSDLSDLFRGTFSEADEANVKRWNIQGIPANGWEVRACRARWGAMVEQYSTPTKLLSQQLVERVLFHKGIELVEDLLDMFETIHEMTCVREVFNPHNTSNVSPDSFPDCIPVIQFLSLKYRGQRLYASHYSFCGNETHWDDSHCVRAPDC